MSGDAHQCCATVLDADAGHKRLPLFNEDLQTAPSQQISPNARLGLSPVSQHMQSPSLPSGATTGCLTDNAEWLTCSAPQPRVTPVAQVAQRPCWFTALTAAMLSNRVSPCYGVSKAGQHTCAS